MIKDIEDVIYYIDAKVKDMLGIPFGYATTYEELEGKVFELINMKLFILGEPDILQSKIANKIKKCESKHDKAWELRIFVESLKIVKETKLF